jgi:hypothetical protein
MTEKANPNFTIDNLQIIKNRITNNIAKESDYATLDYYLNSIGVKDYILNEFIKNNISSYSDYIDEKINPSEDRFKLLSATLPGMIRGVISFLEDYLNNLKQQSSS